MNPVDYAKLCAAKYSLGTTKLKGRGHVMRVPIDRHHSLLRLLPFDKLACPSGHGVEFITPRAIYDSFCQDLLAAGILLLEEPRILIGRVKFWEIVSPTAWTMAQTVIRLGGQLPDAKITAERAAKVERILARRMFRLENDADRQLAAMVLAGAL